MEYRHITPIIMIVLVISVSGCLFRPLETSFPESEVTFEQPLIDDITENVLQGLNENNYTKFTKDMSDIMIKVLPEPRFSELYALISQTSGQYISKELASSEEYSGYVVYKYNCKFEKENVTVTTSFRLGYYEVEGMWLDSENLRQATGK